MIKINEDSRGLFVELANDYKFFNYSPVKQISYLTINPGCVRGHHYHKETHEAFILLEGECNLIVFAKNKCTGFDKTMQPFIIYDVVPGEEHTLISRKGAKLLVFSSKCFDPNNPDTFIYEDPSNNRYSK